jgi:class 3 adenylate cyclase/tetratricopeptide (TPR) repeat protein
MSVCPSCGQENRAEARFCDTCGASLQEAPAATREERKVVTVLFCDIVGSTARADGADPEDVRAALSGFHTHVREELERFGGTVEKFIGDAVMAVFGAPVVHEDDAERAVRAAFAIRDWAADESIDVRIAVNTGEALVSVGAHPEAGEAMVAGDVVNTAARLQAAAPVNGILVAEATRRATERAIEYGEPQGVAAKGKAEPIVAAEAIEARSRFGVDLAQPGRVGLVGREHELELLGGALTRVRKEEAPQLLTLVGVPGIGKSRLVRELFQVVEADPELIFWRQGRSLPYGEGVSYWALAEMVKAQAGILESDSGDEVQDKLRRAVAAVVDGEEASWVEAHLRPLLGLGEDGDQRGDTRAEAFAAWRRFLEALADQGPLVLVFEDLHWADDGLLDFVDHLVDWASGVPMLLVCTARPELLARRPGWGGGKPNATTVSLAPLSSEETVRLIHSLLDQAVLPAEVQTTLLERAGGNPLYAEEFARITVERETADAAELPLPESIQGLIAARIDALSADEKATLEDAAVVGKVFWVGSVAELRAAGREPVEAALHSLERKEFVQRERRSAIAGEYQYAFRHGLVRDVAYSQIPRARRAEKHRLAASWIESIGRPEEHAELLAHHYLSALEFARAAGQELDDLAAPAKNALRVAGERAFALNAFRAAARFYRAALDLSAIGDRERPKLLLVLGRAEEPFDDVTATRTLTEARAGLLALERSDRAAEADVLLADIYWRHGDAEAARARLESAAALVEDTQPSASKAFVLSQLSRFHMLAARDDEALRFGAEALAMADELGLEDVRADALNNIGSAGSRAGELGGAAELEESIEILERRGSVQALRSYNNLLHLHLERGALDRAAELAERAVESAERFGYAEWLHWLREKRAQLWHLSGDWDDAVRLVDQELAAVEAGAPHYLETAWSAIRCLVRLPRGDRAGAIRDSERCLAVGRQVGDAQMLQPALALRIWVLSDVGERERAAPLLDELLAGMAERNGLRSHYWWYLSEAALEHGRREEFLALARAGGGPWIEAATARVLGDVEKAVAAFAAIGARPLEAAARQRAAEALFAAGRRAEGEAELEPALAFWRSVGATAYLHEGEALLAAAS